MNFVQPQGPIPQGDPAEAPGAAPSPVPSVYFDDGESGLPAPSTPEDMKAEIQRHLSMLNFRHNKLKQKRAEWLAKHQETKKQFLREIFAKLEEAGVNFKDPASIASFFQGMRQENPDGYMNLMSALDGLDPSKGPQPPKMPPIPGMPEKFAGAQGKM